VDAGGFGRMSERTGFWVLEVSLLLREVVLLLITCIKQMRDYKDKLSALKKRRIPFPHS
jgi:hypothetical protein